MTEFEHKNNFKKIPNTYEKVGASMILPQNIPA